MLWWRAARRGTRHFTGKVRPRTEQPYSRPGQAVSTKTNYVCAEKDLSISLAVSVVARLYETTVGFHPVPYRWSKTLRISMIPTATDVT
jgi:hypothetical protein